MKIKCIDCKKSIVKNSSPHKRCTGCARTAKLNDKRQYIRRIKDICYEAYGGYECKCCGEIEPLFLTLDHVNNDGAIHRKKIDVRANGSGSFLYSWIIKNDFPKGIFQISCSNCNSGRARNGGICPHKRRNK